MTAYGKRDCSLCNKEIKDGDEYNHFNIHGKHKSICCVCFKPIRNKIIDEIIKKIK